MVCGVVWCMVWCSVVCMACSVYGVVLCCVVCEVCVHTSMAPCAYTSIQHTPYNKQHTTSSTQHITCMCIPSFSESIARAILQHFNGSMRELRDALRAPVPFPDVPISATGRLGRERIAKLQEIFNPPE